MSDKTNAQRAEPTVRERAEVVVYGMEANHELDGTNKHWGERYEWNRNRVVERIAEAISEAEQRGREQERVHQIWIEGCPDKTYSSEWFIAKLVNGDRVVLRALPEGWTYDYKTADETYIKRGLIKSWMQFPDSQFIPYKNITDLESKLSRAVEALKFYANPVHQIEVDHVGPVMKGNPGKLARQALREIEGEK
jgi:hypothetical protein